MISFYSKIFEFNLQSQLFEVLSYQKTLFATAAASFEQPCKLKISMKAPNFRIANLAAQMEKRWARDWRFSSLGRSSIPTKKPFNERGAAKLP